MTNDGLHASIAAALVQANLSFSTAVGTVGDRSLRTFEVEFELPRSKGKCLVSAYVTPPLLTAFGAVEIRSAMRQKITDALTAAMPMSRLLRDPRESTDAEFHTAWVEVSVPVPATDLNPTTPMVGIPPWSSLPAFMSVPAAVDFIASNFSDDVRIPSVRATVPVYELGGTLPIVGSP